MNADSTDKNGLDIEVINLETFSLRNFEKSLGNFVE
jgi:hypothetical protein